MLYAPFLYDLCCQVNILCAKLLQFNVSFAKMIFVVLTRKREKILISYLIQEVKYMPNIKGAIKRVKTNEKANAANTQVKSAMRTAVKKARVAIAENSENAQELLKAATKSVDKAASKGLIHKNAAARLKSRLTKQA